MWQSRPPVASQSFSRSPGGVPAAVRIVSPGLRRLVHREDQLALAHPLARRRGWRAPRAAAAPLVAGRVDLGAVARVRLDAAAHGPVVQRAAAPRARRPTTGSAPSLCASRPSTLIATKRTSRVLEERVRAGREVGQPRADGDHEVGVARDLVRARVALEPEPAEPEPRVLLHGALAGERLARRGSPMRSANVASAVSASE